MNTITRPGSLGYNMGPREGTRVDASLLYELQERGFTRPVRSLSDPRLRLPELLLMEGWERSSSGRTITYTRTLDADPECGQQVIFGTSSREIRTKVDGRLHSLKASPDGIEEEYLP